jgi:hypothetical protein
MSAGGRLVLAIEVVLVALFVGSAIVLGWNSHNFLLAERQVSLRELPIGGHIDFGDPGDQAGMLLGGWHRQAGWGAVATERTAALALKLPQGEPSVIRFSSPIPVEEPSTRRISVSLDGTIIAWFAIASTRDDAKCDWSLTLPPTSKPLSVLTFSTAFPTLPAGLTQAPNLDHMMLGLTSLTLTSTAQPPQCDNGATLAVSSV